MTDCHALFLIRSLDIGGAERQLVELASGLQRSGWVVTVLTFYGKGALETPLRGAGVPIICLDKKGRWDVLPFMYRLVRAIRHRRPQIVHGSIDMCNVLLAILRPLIPEARLVWSLAASDMDLNYYGRLAKLEFALGVLLSRVPDSVICNSAAGRAYHIKCGYPAESIVVIPNGVDVERFKPDSVARSQVRLEWGIGPHQKLVGLVGRLDAMKDHPNFLRAAAGVARLRKDTQFVCVGDGPTAYREELRSLGSQLALDGRLIWAGQRDDVWRIYNALDLAVSSSRSEGLPNVVAEAMATEVPCVVTDVGDSAALVGDLGRVCPARDSAALERAIIQALDEPPRRSLLRDRIRTHYSAATLIERTAAHFASLLTNSAPPRRQSRSVLASPGKGRGHEH